MKNRITSLSILAVLLVQAGTAFAQPANDYACQVTTFSDEKGVVMVQADDVANAVNTAGMVNATRLDGVLERVKSVVKCISFPEERFSDAEVQAYIDARPR